MSTFDNKIKLIKVYGIHHFCIMQDLRIGYQKYPALHVLVPEAAAPAFELVENVLHPRPKLLKRGIQLFPLQ